MAIGMYLFLGSLGMLFFASMLAYILIRNERSGSNADITVHLPVEVWASTAVLILASFTIHLAYGNIRLERQKPFRAFLVITLLLAIAFLGLQTPVMISLFRQTGGSKSLAPFVGVLVMVHAIHVVGGVIAMVLVNIRAARGKYDHEANMGVRHAALYWHFLDAVWLVMLTMFLVTG
jgi:cytochrome c oxidase subunit 3